MKERRTDSGQRGAGEPRVGEGLAGELSGGEALAGEPRAGKGLTGEPGVGEGLAGKPGAGEGFTGESGGSKGLAGEPHTGEALAAEMGGGSGADAGESIDRGLAEAAEASFWGYLGCELVSVGEGRAAVRLDIRPFHLNTLGIVHGGVLASMLDNTMGLAAMRLAPDGKAVTAGLNIHYLQNVGAGMLTCEAELVHRSRRTLTLKAAVVDAEGGLLAWGSGSFRLVT